MVNLLERLEADHSRLWRKQSQLLMQMMIFRTRAAILATAFGVSLVLNVLFGLALLSH